MPLLSSSSSPPNMLCIYLLLQPFQDLHLSLKPPFISMALCLCSFHFLTYNPFSSFCTTQLTMSCKLKKKSTLIYKPKSKFASIIQPFNNYLLSIYYVLDTLLTTGNIVLNKTDKVSALMKLSERDRY